MLTSEMKVAVVQFNPIVGDISGNCMRMLELYQIADARNVDLVVFPEMATTGYPIEDLATSPLFVSTASDAVTELLAQIQRVGRAGILFGCLTKTVMSDIIAQNSACLFDPSSPNTPQYIAKYELPNYGVFDEKRVFLPSNLDDLRPLTFRGKRLGVMICEDCWFRNVSDRVGFGSDVLIALNGSPYEIGKNVVRINVAKERIIEGQDFELEVGIRQQPFLYVNMVGGQDELVFDGGSFLISENGLDQLPFFSETIEYLNVPLGHRVPTEFSMPEASGVASIYNATVLGLRDYMRKQGFKSAVLGMSGGVDSGIVAAIAADAIGPENVHLIRLPSKFSSDGSLTDAASAAIRLGSPIRTIPIEPVVDALRVAYKTAQPATPVLNPVSRWQDGLTGVADENIQARARGNILMSISNQEGHILLTTGNKSEVSVGYSTLYGDMAGGFNPIKDCYKTTVWDMCRYRNALTETELAQLGFLGRVGEMVPEEIIVKPPSAELRPDQQDSDSLPPYDVLDDILRKMIEGQKSVSEISRLDGRDPETVSKVRFLLDRAEYKRRQAAPGVKITSKLHGRERRVPIINHFSGEERKMTVREFSREPEAC